MTPSDCERLATIVSARRSGFLLGFIITEQIVEASVVLCLAAGGPKQFTRETLSLVLEDAENWLMLNHAHWRTEPSIGPTDEDLAGYLVEPDLTSAGSVDELARALKERGDHGARILAAAVRASVMRNHARAKL